MNGARFLEILKNKLHMAVHGCENSCSTVIPVVVKWVFSWRRWKSNASIGLVTVSISIQLRTCGHHLKTKYISKPHQPSPLYCCQERLLAVASVLRGSLQSHLSCVLSSRWLEYVWIISVQMFGLSWRVLLPESNFQIHRSVWTPGTCRA